MGCRQCRGKDGKPVPLNEPASSERQKRTCPRCGKEWVKHAQFYRGLIFHDLRRTAIRAMVRSGISRKTAMRISGHETESIFNGYDIEDEQDMTASIEKLETYQREMMRRFERENERARVDVQVEPQGTGTYQ